MKYEHNDINNLDAFNLNIKEIWEPKIETPFGNMTLNNQKVIYSIDGNKLTPLGNSRSKQYQLVNPIDLFSKHAKKLSEVNNLNLSKNNIEIVDNVYDGGRKQQRSITFKDMIVEDVDDKSTIFMKSDTYNSVDMSWMFQNHTGGFRDSCSNGCVFGGTRLFHTKQKHTTNLNIDAILKQVTNIISNRDNNKQVIKQYQDKKMTRREFAYILVNTICKKINKLNKYDGIEEKYGVNKKLLGYFLDKFDMYSSSLGNTVWAGYNSLTDYSTHVNGEYERNGVIYKMTRANASPHTARMKREDKILSFLNDNLFLTFLNTGFNENQLSDVRSFKIEQYLN